MDLDTRVAKGNTIYLALIGDLRSYQRATREFTFPSFVETVGRFASALAPKLASGARGHNPILPTYPRCAVVKVATRDLIPEVLEFIQVNSKVEPDDPLDERVYLDTGAHIVRYFEAVTHLACECLFGSDGEPWRRHQFDALGMADLGGVQPIYLRENIFRSGDDNERTEV
jgi:hypothetical protein